MGRPGPAPSVTLDETLRVFTTAATPCTPLTATEVAEDLGCTRRTAYRKLEALAERGDLETKKAGAHSRVWWRPVDRTEDAEEGYGKGTEHVGEFADAIENHALFALDPDGTVTDWNRGAERVLGYGEEEVLGEHVSIFHTEDAVERGAPGRNLEAAAERGRFEDEGWRVRADGSAFWAETTLTAIRDDGELQGYAIVTRDRTEREQRERQHRRERDVTERILEAVPMSVAVVNRQGEVERLNKRARERLGLDPSATPEADDWDVYDEEGDLVPPEERPYGQVFETGEPVYDWEGKIDLSTGRAWASVTAVPLGEADPPERVVLVSEDVTRLKEQARRLERRREDLEAELDELFDRVDDAFFALDEAWRFTYLNERAEALVQKSATAVLGERIWEVLPETTDGVLYERFQAAMERQEPASFELYVDSLDGWIEVNAYPSETGLSVYFREITDRVEREQELAESRERYRTLVDQFPNGAVTMFEDTPEGPRYTAVGGETFDEGELDAEALEGSLVEEALPDGLARRLVPQYRAVLDGESRSFEITSSGRVLQFRVVPLRDDDGEVFSGIAISQDITERVEHERELEQYRAIVESVNDGVYTVDETGTITRVNASYAEMVGRSRDELVGTDIADVVGEDVAERARELEWELASGERETATLEADLESANGESVVTEATFSLLPPVELNSYERVAVVRDVTCRKAHERELEESEERHRSLTNDVLDTSDVGMFILDSNFDVVWINQATEEYFGLDREEIIGRDKRKLVRERIADIFEESGRFADRVTATYDDNTYTEEFECHLLGEGGLEERWLRHWSQPIDSGLYAGGRIEHYTDITERKEHERELARFKRAVEASGHPIYMTDTDGRITYANAAFEETTGYAAEEAVGETPHILRSSEHGEAYYQDLWETVLDGEVWEEEITDRRKNGEVYHAEQTIAPVTDEEGGIDRFVAVQTDVTERKEYERELSRYETLIEESTDVNAVLDEEGTIQYITPSAEHVLGYDPDELVGENSFDYVHPDDVEKTRKAFSQFVDREDYRPMMEFRFEHADGSWVWLEAEKRDLRDDPDIGGLVVYTRDVTDRKRFEQQLNETVEQLEESNERLEQFAYAASHDLQEPLRMISNYLGLVEERYADELDEDGQEFIEFAVDGADRMREMIEDLLAYSRVDTRGGPFEPTDCEDVVDGVLRNLQMQIEEQDADIEVGCLPTVTADGNQLEQVFQNLVSNAIKYSGDAPPEIEISAERDGDEWVFRVADDGIGMDPDQTDRIFDVFDRLHTHEEYPGTGIGLALCRKIVERHGGEIWVESELGEGSTFSFTVPTTENARDRDESCPETSASDD